MMAQGRNIDENTIFVAIECRALGEATKDVGIAKHCSGVFIYFLKFLNGSANSEGCDQSRSGDVEWLKIREILFPVKRQFHIPSQLKLQSICFAAKFSSSVMLQSNSSDSVILAVANSYY